VAIDFASTQALSLDDLRFLSLRARKVWSAIRDAVPQRAYLAGDTALAVHLQHRPTDSFDFLIADTIDLNRLWGDLRKRGKVKVETLDSYSLLCDVDGTRVQFLLAPNIRLLFQPTTIDGIRIASLEDLFAAKIVGVAQRVPPEVSDCVDLWAIETRAGRFFEEGIALTWEKYPHAKEPNFIIQALSALAYLQAQDRVPLPPVAAGRRNLTYDHLSHYWSKRIPEILRNLDPLRS
jgi:hypothetical protein